MQDFRRITGINLGIILVAAIVLRLFIRESYDLEISPYGLLMAVLVLVQALTNLVAAAVAAGRRWTFLLNTLLVLLIGLGVCGAGAASIPRSTSPYAARPVAPPG